MSLGNPKFHRFALLPNDDSEGLEEFDHSDTDDDASEGNEGVATPLVTFLMGSKEFFLWVICYPIAIATTKSLLVDHGLHYPLTFAFLYFVLLLFAYTIWYFCLRSSKLSYHTLDGEEPFPKLDRRRLSPSCVLCFTHNADSTDWVSTLPASLAASLSLPLLLEGILHMPSLPVLVMLSPLVYATENVTLFLYDMAVWNKKRIPWDVLVIISACSVVLYEENRLMVPGLVFGITGVLSLGLCRASQILNPGADLPPRNGFHAFVMTTLALGIITCGTMAYFSEIIQAKPPLTVWTSAILILNIVTVVGTLFPRTSLIEEPISMIDRRESSSIFRRDLALSIGFALVPLSIAILSSPLQYVRGVQIAAYLVASICLLGGINLSICQDATMSKYISSQLATKVMFALLITGTSFILAFTSSASINALPVGPSTNLDLSYRPDSRFDIVISIYQEDPVSVKRMVNQITSTSLLQDLNLQGYKPRVILYTKDPAIDIDSLKKATNADVVEQLENVGREGGTYLHHIVTKWESLAEQTMFIQAHAHNLRELIPRVNDYLVSNTGMLSLGFTGVTCPCGDCGDRWGWADQNNVLPTIYEQIYNQSCDLSQPILLSYKGQFVASARRIRGVRQDIYTSLLRAATSLDGWNQSTVITNSRATTQESEEDLSNPMFGFTMERIWSLLMQCGTDERIAARCPSLLSGRGIGGLAQDCQCLDKYPVA